jgi:hypothetical protein
MTIPNELINKILSFREKHSIRKILVCVHCGEEEYFNDYLYIYHRIRSWSSNNNGRWTIHVKKKFEIVCSECNYELSKN